MIICLNGLLEYFHCYLETRAGRGDIFFDALMSVQSLIMYLFCYFTFHLFLNEPTITELLEWCRTLYITHPDELVVGWKKPILEELEQTTLKLQRFTSNWPVVEITLLVIPCLLGFVLFDERKILYPLYSNDGFVTELPWFFVILAWGYIYCIALNKQVAFNLTTYILLNNHVVAQLKIVAKIFENLGPSTLHLLEPAIRAHIEVLDQALLVSELFSRPMFVIEGITLSATVFAGICFILSPENAVIAAGVVTFILCGYLYSFFGQSLMESSLEVADAVYNGNWVDLSVNDRKKLLLVLMRAQRPAGIMSGGYHLMCKEQFANLIKTGYNLMIFVKNMIDK